MKSLEEIKSEIEALPRREYMKLVHWLFERDWKAWDQEIESDSKSRKLDFLIDEGFADKEKAKLRDL